jgi:hypothetical protein
MSADAVVWSFDPWRESPARATAGLAGSLVCAVLPVFAGLPWLASLALAVCGFAAFHDRLLPVACRVDERGVERRVGPVSERRGWSQLRGARWQGGALWLSPFRHPSWLGRFRDLELPLPGADRDALRGALTDALGRHGL